MADADKNSRPSAKLMAKVQPHRAFIESEWAAGTIIHSIVDRLNKEHNVKISMTTFHKVLRMWNLRRGMLGGAAPPATTTTTTTTATTLAPTAATTAASPTDENDDSGETAQGDGGGAGDEKPAETVRTTSIGGRIPGRPSIDLEPYRDAITRYHDAGMTIDNIIATLRTYPGVSISRSTMRRHLAKWGLTRQIRAGSRRSAATAHDGGDDADDDGDDDGEAGLEENEVQAVEQPRRKHRRLYSSGPAPRSGNSSSGSNRSGYTPAWPATDFPSVGVREFVAEFYRLSDNQMLDELWVSRFEPRATVVIGTETANGEEAIRRMRKGMWEGVSQRKHFVEKAFPGTLKSFPGTVKVPVSVVPAPAPAPGGGNGTEADVGTDDEVEQALAAQLGQVVMPPPPPPPPPPPTPPQLMATGMEERPCIMEELELMLMGEVRYALWSGGSQLASWSAHGLLRRRRKEPSPEVGGRASIKVERADDEWKFASYRVWIQRY